MDYLNKRALIIHIANRLAEQDGYRLDFPEPYKPLIGNSDELISRYTSKAFDLYEVVNSWIFENSSTDQSIQSLIRILRNYINFIDNDDYKDGADHTLDNLLKELGVQEEGSVS